MQTVNLSEVRNEIYRHFPALAAYLDRSLYTSGSQPQKMAFISQRIF
jgi:hypothetical protein